MLRKKFTMVIKRENPLVPKLDYVSKVEVVTDKMDVITENSRNLTNNSRNLTIDVQKQHLLDEKKNERKISRKYFSSK